MLKRKEAVGSPEGHHRLLIWCFDRGRIRGGEGHRLTRCSLWHWSKLWESKGHRESSRVTHTKTLLWSARAGFHPSEQVGHMGITCWLLKAQSGIDCATLVPKCWLCLYDIIGLKECFTFKLIDWAHDALTNRVWQTSCYICFWYILNVTVLWVVVGSGSCKDMIFQQILWFENICLYP